MILQEVYEIFKSSSQIHRIMHHLEKEQYLSTRGYMEDAIEELEHEALYEKDNGKRTHMIGIIQSMNNIYSEVINIITINKINVESSPVLQEPRNL